LLLAFLLGPLVIRFRHWGFGRVPSAIVVVFFSFLLIGSVGAMMTSQLTDLAHKMPEYQHNVREKLHSLRTSGSGLLTRATRFVRNFSDVIPAPAPAPKPETGEEKPVPVEIRQGPFSDTIQKLLGSVLNVVLMGGIVIVFVIFMLIQREDMRDRLIRLAGLRRVNVTTKLLDDAAHRISRYLLAQLGINFSYGVLVGVGLYFIGVPNPVLWAALATLLRYIPYLGIWIAAIMPAAVALAVDPGWLKLLLVFSLYFGVDILVYNFVEPLLYGNSTGISPIAILVAAVFWTWLWGPVGLLLSTPLTVCLAVIGRHVPRLEFLSVMLSDEQVLSADTRLYQRLLAMDLDEATEVAEEFLKGKSLEEFYDKVVVPALSLAEEDRHRNKLDDARQHFIFENARLLVEDIAARSAELIAGNTSKPRSAKTSPPPERDGDSAMVVCVPARDEADEVAALMLTQLLQRRGIPAKSLCSSALAGECLEVVAQSRARVVCVVAVPPHGYMHARYLCRRLHTEFQQAKVVAAILTERDVTEIKRREPRISADEVAASLQEALSAVISLVPTKTETDQPALVVS
jgi:predicted PurR-regulated permease PerM